MVKYFPVSYAKYITLNERVFLTDIFAMVKYLCNLLDYKKIDHYLQFYGLQPSDWAVKFMLTLISYRRYFDVSTAVNFVFVIKTFLLQQAFDLGVLYTILAPCPCNIW